MRRCSWNGLGAIEVDHDHVGIVRTEPRAQQFRRVLEQRITQCEVADHPVDPAEHGVEPRPHLRIAAAHVILVGHGGVEHLAQQRGVASSSRDGLDVIQHALQHLNGQARPVGFELRFAGGGRRIAFGGNRSGQQDQADGGRRNQKNEDRQPRSSPDRDCAA